MYDDRQCLGKNADYALLPVKQKCLNYYVSEQPMSALDLAQMQLIYLQIPVGMQLGIRIRTWSMWQGAAPFTETMVGYTIYDEQGGSEEVLAPAATFNVNSVPWDKVIA